MQNVLIPICALVLSLSVTACKEKAPDTTADAQALRDNEAAWVKDWQAKDVDKITAHYAPDATLLIAGIPVMKGTDAIKAGLGGMLKDPHLSLTFSPTSVVIAKGDDLAYTQGVYTMTYTEPKTGMTLIEKGKYVTVYKKQDDGSWKVVEDIDNADGPAMPASPQGLTPPKT